MNGMNISLRLAGGMALVLNLVAMCALAADTKEAGPGIPPELKGFKGMMTGELIEKGETTLVFKVSTIKKVWKANQAEQPGKAAGKTLTVNLKQVSAHHRARIMENFRALRKGDAIELELFDLGEKTLCVKEWLRKAGD